MNFSFLGKIPIINNYYFLIRDDGHIFDFNFETFKWSDATQRVFFDGTWDLFYSLKEFYISLITTYEKRSENYNDTQSHPSFSWGSSITYYKKNGKIRGLDELKNEYECKIPYMIISDDNLIDDTWCKIQRYDVFAEIGNFNESLDITDLDLYKDPNNNLRAFSKDKKEYRISKLTGDAMQILDSNGVNPEYISVNKNFIANFCTKKPELFLSWLDLLNMKEMDKYILKSKKELCEKYNIILGKDFLFYNNGWGDIYASDNNKREYHVLPESLVPVKTGTIRLEEWETINHLLALEYAKFYQQRKKELSKNNSEILSVDLKLYKNKNLEFFGFDEKGTYYKLEEDGHFKSSSNTIKIKEIDKYKCKPYEAVIEQGINNANFFFNCYIEYCCQQFSENEKKEFGKKSTLFVKLNPDEKTVIYLIDSQYNEFKCNIDSLEKVCKGTVKDSYTKIPKRQFLFYINLVRIEEDNKNIFSTISKA